MSANLISSDISGLRGFLKATKHWRQFLTGPKEVKQRQLEMAHVRQEVLPAIPPLRRTAIELVLRRHQRLVDQRIDQLIGPYQGKGEPEPAHSDNYPQAIEVWDVSNARVLETHGPAAMFHMAYRIRFNILRARLSRPTTSDALSRSTRNFKSTGGAIPELSGYQINPYSDYCAVLASQSGGFKYETRVWQEVKHLAATLKIPAHLEVQTFQGLCRTKMYQRNQLMDMMLEWGVPWQEVFDTLPASAQDHIRTHAVYKRSELLKVAQRHTCVSSSSASHRPMF